MLGSRKPKLNQMALFTSPGAAANERLKQRYGTNQKGNRIITGHNNSGFDALVLLRRDQQLLQQRSVSISRFPHRWAEFSFLEYYMSSLRKEKQNAICSHAIIKSQAGWDPFTKTWWAGRQQCWLPVFDTAASCFLTHLRMLDGVNLRPHRFTFNRQSLGLNVTVEASRIHSFGKCYWLLLSRADIVCAAYKRFILVARCTRDSNQTRWLHMTVLSPSPSSPFQRYLHQILVSFPFLPTASSLFISFIYLHIIFATSIVLVYCASI